MLADSPSGRLYPALVEAKKATQIGGSQYQLRDPGYWIVGADLRKDQSIDEAQKALLDTLDAIPARPVTQAEVDRAKAAMLKNIELGLNDASRVGLQMSEWIAQGDWRLFFIHRDRLRTATAADVNRVALAYLKPSNRTVGVYIPTDKPDRATIPATPDIDALVKDYKGDAVVAAGEAFDPSPENIETRARRIQLQNGFQVALLPKKTRGGSVVVSATFRFGDEKSLFGKSTDASMAGAMLMRGTTKHTRQQIREELDRLKARAGVGGGVTSANLQIETTRENLPATLTLMAEILREASFPAAEFESLKAARLTQIEDQKSEPQLIASREMARHLNPYPKGDVRYRETIDEEIAELKAATVEKARQFYQDFYGASNAQLAIVGEFDEAAVMSVIRDKYATWKSPKPYARVSSAFTAAAPVNRSFVTPDKTNAAFYAGINLRAGRRDFGAGERAMFGGGFPNCARRPGCVRRKASWRQLVAVVAGRPAFGAPPRPRPGGAAFGCARPEGRLHAGGARVGARRVAAGTHRDALAGSATRGPDGQRSVSRTDAEVGHRSRAEGGKPRRRAGERGAAEIREP